MYKMPPILTHNARVTPSSLVPISVNYETLDSMDQYGLSTEMR